MMKCLWFKGRVKNLDEINAKTAAAGYGSADTVEGILVNAYACWGEEMPLQLNGVFAFALYDEEKKYWFCARDRFCERVIYYGQDAEGNLVPGRTMEEVLEGAKIVPELEDELIENYIGFSFLPGQRTFFKHVYKVPAAHSLICKDGEITVKPYWEPHFVPDDPCDDEALASELYDAICEAVKGYPQEGNAFLSSGVDSSLMCSLVKPKNVYTGFYQEAIIDEYPDAKATAELVGAHSIPFTITKEAFLEAVPKVIRALEQPTGDASAVALFLLCQEVSKSSDHVFSGECIDELFGGYNSLKRFLDVPDEMPYNHRYCGSTHIMRDDAKKELLQKYYDKNDDFSFMQRAYRLTRGQDAVTQATMCDILVYLDDSLMPNIEAFGPANGFEILTPFADNRVYDIALRIPAKSKITENGTKQLFRKAAAHKLPHEIAFRQKLGFPVPIRVWMHTPEYMAEFKEKFSSDYAAQYFHTDLLLQMLTDFDTDEQKAYLWRHIWAIYMFLKWYEMYFVK